MEPTPMSNPGARRKLKLPQAPLTLTVEQIEELNQQLSDMRHDINNYLSVVMAAAQLMPLKPQMSESLSAMLLEQPAKIQGAIFGFSQEFEKALGITRPE